MQTSKEIKDKFALYLVWFGLVPMFNGILTFVGYLMPKPCLLKKSSDTF